MNSKITELGCAGHLIVADQCRFRRHTQVGKKYRVSTVGDLHYWNDRATRQTIGATGYYETMVFETTGKLCEGNEGCGCLEVKSWSEIDAKRYDTAGEAQKGHEAFVRKYAKALR